MGTLKDWPFRPAGGPSDGPCIKGLSVDPSCGAFLALPPNVVKCAMMMNKPPPTHKYFEFEEALLPERESVQEESLLSTRGFPLLINQRLRPNELPVRVSLT